MKNQRNNVFLRTSLMALFVLICVLPTSAKSSVRNFVNLNLQGGFATLADNNKLTQTNFGYAGGVQFQYELNYRRLIFNVGLEADYMKTNTSMNGFETLFTDWKVGYTSTTIPDQYKYKYEKWNERQTSVNAYLPINVGVYFTSHIYATVGAKVGYRFVYNYETAADMYTAGYYERFYQWITNTPTIGAYPLKTYEVKGDLNKGLDIDAAFEVGGRFPLPQKNMNIRVAAYCDYGITDHVQNKGLAVADYSNVAQQHDHSIVNQKNLEENLMLNSIVRSEQFKDNRFNNVTVGVKVTFQFALPVPGTCICDPMVY